MIELIVLEQTGFKTVSSFKLLRANQLMLKQNGLASKRALSGYHLRGWFVTTDARDRYTVVYPNDHGFLLVCQTTPLRSFERLGVRVPNHRKPVLLHRNTLCGWESPGNLGRAMMGLSFPDVDMFGHCQKPWRSQLRSASSRHLCQWWWIKTDRAGVQGTRHFGSMYGQMVIQHYYNMGCHYYNMNP